MATMEDLPTELINYVTDHLRHAGDLAAFARTSRRLYNVVDPVLYNFAKTKVDDCESWHPLRWGAENGQTGTLKKALVAGIDANLLFDVNVDKLTRDMQSFQIRVEAVDGKAIWTPPEWNPTEEWRPADDDTDHDYLARTMLEKQPTEYPSRDYYRDMDTRFAHDDYTDSSDFAEGMSLYQTAIIDSDSWAMSEASDEDDQDGSHFGSDEGDAVVQGFRALHLAARGGHDDAVQVLLEYGADIDMCSGELCNCESGYARSHAGFHGVPMNRTATAGFSPLHLAICHFQMFTAKLLLSQGASIRMSEPGRDSAATALHAAAATGQTKLCRHLLDHGYVSDVDILDSSGLSPFYYAYFNGHWDTTVAFLLEKGANIDFLVSHPNRMHPSFDDDQSTILFEACAYGRYEDAIKLIRLGADVSKGDYRGDTQLQWPLHAVCRPPNNFEEPLRHPPLKLSAEADKNAHKRVELIEMMLRQGADIEVKSSAEGETPLHFAAKYDLDAALHALLAAGAKVESRKNVQPLQNEELHRMLLATIQDRPANFEAMNLLLDLDFDGFLYTKSTYLMNMVNGGHHNLACEYLERGTAVPPLSPKEKMTILHEAIERGVLALARRMLLLKVSVNSVNKNGHTPLYAIISRTGNIYGRDSFVKALLDAGADIHFRPSAGSLMTPLEKAIVSREQSLVELMLRSQPLRSDSQAVLPPLRPKGVYLHAAARTLPSKRMFSALIRSGASVTELDSNGDTPLSVFLKTLVDQPTWMAHTQGAASEVCGTIWYLWSKDVDINRKNKAGKSILGYLTALRLYNGRDPARVRLAREMQRRIAIVPAKDPGNETGDKALEFRHEPEGFGAVLDDGRDD
ncbi:hypothetical protein VMCG_06317 [Cytospora schulzeri]|uniref:F-box domain-containing protein n=1 Tax=Cytospora schulzeri TaxID=448051 RepID=A0A423W855_9PEZI|nr:hypothetical protein VMCG_06317 [Valsa malicola]